MHRWHIQFLVRELRSHMLHSMLKNVNAAQMLKTKQQLKKIKNLKKYSKSKMSWVIPRFSLELANNLRNLNKSVKLSLCC